MHKDKKRGRYMQMKSIAPRNSIPYQKGMLDNTGMSAQSYFHGKRIPQKTREKNELSTYHLKYFSLTGQR
jgi:hypothetical protein